MEFQGLPVQNGLEKSMWFCTLFLEPHGVFIADFLTSLCSPGENACFFFLIQLWMEMYCTITKKLANESCLEISKKEAWFFLQMSNPN